MEPKQLLILGACKSKTPCAMIQTSAWQRLCVCSPEVTGSCLVTSVACTMEPRKIRKLKVLTGFRPVSDPLPRCFRTLFFFLLLAFFFKFLSFFDLFWLSFLVFSFLFFSFRFFSFLFFSFLSFSFLFFSFLFCSFLFFSFLFFAFLFVSSCFFSFSLFVFFLLFFLFFLSRMA